MASVSMMASFVGAAVAQPTNRLRTLAVAKAATKGECQEASSLNLESEEDGWSNSRRAAMFVVAAVAVTAVAGAGEGMAAFLDELSKRGTLEARKKYAPICVTIPTARVCNKIA